MSSYTANYQKGGGLRGFSDYYTAAYDGALSDKTLRDNVTFADHSLATDSVFSETQFVSCRNVLIYFNRKLQDRALGLFHESLSHRTFLGLARPVRAGVRTRADFSQVMKQAAARRSVSRGFRRAVEAVAIGASAGGVDALLALLSGLPASYALPIVVVLHQAEDRDSLLSDLFANRAALRVREAADKEPLAPGTLYFAPPGYHLLLESDRSFSLSCDAPEHYSRPSIDVLFELAADALGAGLAAVLLTSANEDGAAGLARVGRLGGLTVVQDRDEAQNPEMPRAGLACRQ